MKPTLTDDCQAVWNIVERHTCPDCFHGGCLAISDAAIALVKAMGEDYNNGSR